MQIIQVFLLIIFVTEFYYLFSHTLKVSLFFEENLLIKVLKNNNYTSYHDIKKIKTIDIAKTIKVTEIVKALYFLRVYKLNPKFSHKISS